MRGGWGVPGQGLFLGPGLFFTVEIAWLPCEGQGWEAGSEWARLWQQDPLPWLLQWGDAVASNALC